MRLHWRLQKLLFPKAFARRYLRLERAYQQGYNDCLIEHGMVNLKITNQGKEKI